MNLNDVLMNVCDRKSKKFKGKNSTKLMCASNRSITKRKEFTPSTSLNWGKSTTSIMNSSVIFKSAGSSKSSEIESRIILALTEGRGDARCEVGLAAFNISRPILTLCQISDSQSYINTLTKINVLNPQEIIIPKTFIENFSGNRLLDQMKHHFPNIKYTGVARNTFNKNRGLERLQELCIPSLNSVLLAIQHKYYALASASALLMYSHNVLNIYYASQSIKVDYQESEGNAIIDISTADNLELVNTTRPALATKYSSLFGVLNYCVTKMGQRTLRSNILQPLYNIDSINDRLDCIAEIIKNSGMSVSLQEILQKVPNMDQILSISTIMPNDAQSCSNRQLNYILLLNTLFDTISSVENIIKNCKGNFFLELNSTLKSKSFTWIKCKVRSVIHDDAHLATGQNGVFQRCFAIKSGINGLLDLVRKTYSERINDMSEYVKTLSEKYDLPLTLGNNSSKGYHIVLTLNKHQKRFMKKSDLPPEFIQVCRLVGSYTMKTPELVNFSSRIDDIMLDILKISNVMIFNLITEVKKHIAIFYKLCEEMAHLDFLLSLADASMGNCLVRPTFSNYTDVRFARHPLLEFLCSSQPISNSIFASKDFNVHIITGPSGSGKSIFIRQVMLLQVMAQIGCYVPAESATFRLIDRMFSRIYLEDNMEFGASSFILEIKEVNYILSTVTENSLVIIDELCRSTCLEEGMSLSMAICEKLAGTSAFLYLSTHFTLLAKICIVYCNMKPWQLETIATGNTPQSMKLDFCYNLKNGVTPVLRSGIYLVRNIWPERIVQIIDRIFKQITIKYNQNLKFSMVDSRIVLKYELQWQLIELKRQSKLTNGRVCELLNDYQTNLDKIGSFQIDAVEELIDPRLNHSIFEDLFMEPENYDRIENGLITDDLRNSEQHLTQLFTSQQFSDIVRQDIIDCQNYQNISHFLKEDSENINKLIPEINISYDENKYLVSNENTFDNFVNNVNVIFRKTLSGEENYYNQENIFNDNIDKDEDKANISDKKYLSLSSETVTKNFTLNNESCLSHTDYHQSISFTDDSKRGKGGQTKISNHYSHVISNFEVHKKEVKNSFLSEMTGNSFSDIENNCSGSVTESLFSKPLKINLKMTSTPLKKEEECNIVSCKNFKNIDVESIRDDIEICTQIFSTHDSFEEVSNNKEFTTISKSIEIENKSVSEVINNPKNLYINNILSQKLDKNIHKEKYEYHIFPNILIQEGQNNASISFEIDCFHKFSSSLSPLNYLPFSLRRNSETNDNFLRKKTNTSNQVSQKGKSNLPSVKTDSKGSSYKESDTEKEIKKKRPYRSKFVSPRKRKNYVSSEDNNELKDISKKRKFIPPRSLTTKEIKAEFSELDRKLFESNETNDSEFSKYLEQYLNRPSVKQIKNQKHLCFVRKTTDGVEVIPGKSETIKMSSQRFSRKLTSEEVDISIFSDKNAKFMEEFLNSKESNFKLFNFNKNNGKGSMRNTFKFNPVGCEVGEHTNNSVAHYFTRKSEDVIKSSLETNFTSSGFYKELKEEKTSIVNKYLQDSNTNDLTEIRSSNNIFQSNSFDSDIL